MRQLIITAVMCVTSHLLAAELQLREDIRPAGPLVLVGDIAEIHAQHSVESSELATIDLMPVPPAGEKRELRLREVQDLLAVRGVNLSLHRFSGASSVTIHGPKKIPAAAEPKPKTAPTRRLSRKIVKQPLEEVTCAAIEAHLNETAGEQDWQVAIELSDERASEIASLGNFLVAVGGSAPWTGKQRFLISAENSDAEAIRVTAEISLPPAVVVARYALPKGSILRADDVKLQPGLPTKGEAEVFQSIEEVVGKEATRTIAEGQILDSRTVRRPLLVRRNEIVTLYSRVGGVTVRTTARVRNDGAEGDAVTVETLQDRKPMFARVSGPQEVEVLAQAVSAEQPSQHATIHAQGKSRQMSAVRQAAAHERKSGN